MMRQTEPFGKSILVVEDDEPVRELLRRFLASEGHLVAAVANPEEALQCMNVQRFDLLVADILLPGGHVEVLSEELKTRAPDVPVLYVSGAVDQPPGPHFLRKPFTREQFLRKVQEVLAGTGSEPRAV